MGGCLSGIQVAVLAGGLGTRIRGVLGDTPKCLAPINGQPFLDGLLSLLAHLGATKVVLCLGHLAHKVIEHLEQVPPPAGLQVETVVETSPLGTAGAIRLALPKLDSDPVMVLNGDTWIDADWTGFVNSHQTAQAAISILCVEVENISRFGSMELDQDGRVLRYVEKDPSRTGSGLISGGVYLFSASSLTELAAESGPSLEQDFLQPRTPGGLHGFISPGAAFIDIGTPESLAAAGTVLNWGVS
jgi:NDP-sugar pyrophosphorylase family protein